jgi:hypothetical protein
LNWPDWLGETLDKTFCRNKVGAIKQDRLLMRTVFFLALMLLIQGCQYDPHAQLYTTDKPQESDVVGRYTLTSQSVTRDGLAVMHGRPCVIELRVDGTFSATNVPPLLLNSPDTNFFSTLISGSGTWRLASVGSVGDGSGSVKTHWGVNLDSVANFQPVGLSGAKPPYGLIYTLGDPDEGLALILEKTK